MATNELWALATDVQIGDRVITENGRAMRVTGVSNGIYRGHLRFDLGNSEHTEVSRTARVQIDRPVHERA